MNTPSSCCDPHESGVRVPRGPKWGGRDEPRVGGPSCQVGGGVWALCRSDDTGMEWWTRSWREGRRVMGGTERSPAMAEPSTVSGERIWQTYQTGMASAKSWASCVGQRRACRLRGGGRRSWDASESGHRIRLTICALRRDSRCRSSRPTHCSLRYPCAGLYGSSCHRLSGCCSLGVEALASFGQGSGTVRSRCVLRSGGRVGVHRTTAELAKAPATM